MKRGACLFVALALIGCKPEEEPEPLDLGEALGADEVRAGVVTDESVLFGGISAEGRAGDVKIYNDRVRFVIQAAREGDYLVPQGGIVIDADVVRPDGQPGRDAVDEWGPMYGIGRLMHPTSVTVTEDGSEGTARVVVEGVESPMALITGTLEAPDVIPDLGLALRIEYVLRPGSSLLEVHSTVTATEDDASIAPGDVLFGADEALDHWAPKGGLLGPFGDLPWSGWVGDQNEVAYVVAADSGETFQGSTMGLLSQLGGLVGGFGEAVAIEAGSSYDFTRWYGVGPDVATITDALLERDGVTTKVVEGVVTAPDGPVAGARVNVLVDGEPYTLAFTGADGSFAADVPAGSTATVLAVGTATRRFLDLPDGAGRYGPYAAAPVTALALQSLVDGAVPVPLAEGRGVGTPEAPLALGQPARLTVQTSDGLPFEVRLVRDDAPSYDPKLVPDGGIGNAWAAGWARDGSVTLLVEGGTYTVQTHRGIRFERDEEVVTIAAGAETTVEVDMPLAYETPGWLLGDPHEHASPSSDAAIPMEDRLIGAASLGLQLHFGTDHDHVADYRPLIAPLGLDGVLGSMVADEVSPTLRGHHNTYPLTTIPERPNNGAFAWWNNDLPDTAAFHAGIRDQYDHDVIIQSNHPMSSGLASSAEWTPGHIGDADRWDEDFDAVEVLNGGDPDAYGFYMDLITRGITPTPVGVSDCHGYTGGNFGASATFIEVGVDEPADATPEALVAAMQAGRTIVTRGPFLDLSIAPGSVLTGTPTLDVEALGPSWMDIDRIRLIRNGVEEQVVDGATASFTLAPDADSVYVVVAEGDTPMEPFYGKTPWAMSGAYFVDVGGDGWTPPLPPLTVE